ncbi:MAG TPA: DUF6677 family protein [Gemmataceae bacterium]|jgi:hypothetical protein|nr:DUF6677 family protein [Gemmataceae bacterium]
MAQHPIPNRPTHLDWFAAFLSYLVPGLGQVYQKRYTKGILFFFALHVLFFYGMWMGSWKNVYLPSTDVKRNSFFYWNQTLGDIENRPHFAGQFWIGVAAWPAIIQYATFEPGMDKKHAVLGTWEREPPESVLNDKQRDGDKRWDLGWVYTVIAGVLNILVIYDALAGPAFRDPKEAAAAATQQQVAVAS